MLMLMIAFGFIASFFLGLVGFVANEGPVPDGMKHDRILKIWYADLRLHCIFNLYVLL